MSKHQSSDRPQLPRLTYTGPYKKAIEICQFYGVSLINPPHLEKETENYTEKFKGPSDSEAIKEPALSINERASMIRVYSDESWDTLSQPVLVMYTKKPNARGERFFYLHAIGVTKCIADMLSIHLAWIILNETVKKNFMIHVNSMGDKDSSSQFTSELTSYYRKRINSLPDDGRESFKLDILNVLKEPYAETQLFQEEAPKSIMFLGDYSRKYFKEVIEFIEAREAPYIIDHSLVEHKDAYSETLFTIREKSDDPKGKVFAVGARSDNLTRGAGMRKTVPIVSTTILIPGATGRESIQKTVPKKKKPLIYFIQLGEEARLRSFTLLEKLRKAKLPVTVSIGKEKMSSQIAQADRLHVPITLIIGQKEAIENTVILRDMETRSQETVSLADIVPKIKALLD
ncbi:MAG: His/Gly/Thr/Pro-type tRNA ligase C-terminal domain-containing protein [Candidatus Paceibacterota bacterium]